MKKKLYIDGYFLTQRITGVQRYAEELISNMRDIGYEIVILAPRNASRIIPGVDIRRNKFLNGLLWQQFYLPIYLFFLGAPV
ncbi:TPA: glycosyltransferase family 4 protein, partial [Enterobacter hormaechei subsp. steigerwaltii]|nr:glycosyltransferase family 4 protein [Enterobacter hormaechei subsp. steigerwaltii]